MESLRSNSSSAEAKHLGPEASADELARAVDRSLCERSSGIMTDFVCEPAMRMGGSVPGPEDALADGVLIADRLDGRPLDGDHGAPARLVSPNQYGFVSTKHVCRIELHTAEPSENYPPSAIVDVGCVCSSPIRGRHPRPLARERELRSPWTRRCCGTSRSRTSTRRSAGRSTTSASRIAVRCSAPTT